MPRETVRRHEAVRYGPWESDYAAIEVSKVDYQRAWDRKNRNPKRKLERKERREKNRAAA